MGFVPACARGSYETLSNWYVVDMSKNYDVDVLTIGILKQLEQYPFAPSLKKQMLHYDRNLNTLHFIS